jgi:hypothetical protein
MPLKQVKHNLENVVFNESELNNVMNYVQLILFVTNPARKGSNSVENLLGGSKRIIKRVGDGLANVWTISYDLTIGTYTFNMKGLKYYKLIHQIKMKTLKILNFHILFKNTTT